VFKARVQSGLGRAARFVSMPAYLAHYSALLGATPFAGTLNAKVRGAADEMLLEIIREAAPVFTPSKAIVGERGKKLLKVGSANAKVSSRSGSCKCLLVFPHGTEHPAQVVEIIAAHNLREKFSLKDGDEITLEVVV